MSKQVTLNSLLEEFGLGGDNATQVKTAAATQTDEVNTVLQSLGLDGADEGVTKVASANENKGDHMSLTGIYEEIFGESTPAATGDGEVVKTASGEVNEATNLFGELTAHYFGTAQTEFLSKVAGAVEEEEGNSDETPMKHLGNNSQLTTTIGKPADPAMAVNHSASSGAPLKTMTGNSSPYSLKVQAIKKAILKRVQVATVGAIKD